MLGEEIKPMPVLGKKKNITGGVMCIKPVVFYGGRFNFLEKAIWRVLDLWLFNGEDE